MGGGSDDTFFYLLISLLQKIYDIHSNDLHVHFFVREINELKGNEEEDEGKEENEEEEDEEEEEEEVKLR